LVQLWIVNNLKGGSDHPGCDRMLHQVIAHALERLEAVDPRRIERKTRNVYIGPELVGNYKPEAFLIKKLYRTCWYVLIFLMQLVCARVRTSSRSLGVAGGFFFKCPRHSFYWVN
jgi:hypothetical protein